MASGMSCLLPLEEVPGLVLVTDDLQGVRFFPETKQFQNFGGRLRASAVEATDGVFETPGSA